MATWLDELKFTLPWSFHQPREPESSYDVPKSVHFIWYGSQANEEVLTNTARCQELNPDRQVTLWSDRPQPEATVPVKLFTETTWPNQDFIDLFSDQLGIRGDLLRYAIIFTHGGMYLDTDVACLLPFHEPMFRRSFVCTELTQYKNVCNSAFAFPAHSAFLAYVLACVRENIETHHPLSTMHLAGPVFFTTCVKQYADARIHHIPQQVMLGHCRRAAEPRPLYAKERLAASWQTQTQDLSKYYRRAFHEPAPSVSIPEPA